MYSRGCLLAFRKTTVSVFVKLTIAVMKYYDQNNLEEKVYLIYTFLELIIINGSQDMN